MLICNSSGYAYCCLLRCDAVYPAGGVPLFQWIVLPSSGVAGTMTLFSAMETTDLCSGYNEMWLGRRVHIFQSIFF